MISKYALALAEHFAEKHIYEKEKTNVYKYGFELLISTVINMICIFLISLLMGVVSGAVFFCLAFIPLRLAAGGYHAKHHWSCILGINVIFLGFAVLLCYMSTKYTLIYSFATSIISSILIWILAPVEAVNKPMKNEQKGRQRKRSLLIACINIAVTILFFTIEEIGGFVPFLAFYNSGAFVASVSLAVAEIVNKKSIINE